MDEQISSSTLPPGPGVTKLSVLSRPSEVILSKSLNTQVEKLRLGERKVAR